MKRAGFAFLSILASAVCFATQPKTVKVGFSYDGDFMYKDGRGRYCGYEVEYLYNVAQTAGWQIQFIDINDLNDLNNGSIDMLCGIVRTPEREKEYLFSDKRMGATYCTLLVRQDDLQYIYDDPSTLRGIRTGIEKHSFLDKTYSRWCKTYGINSPVTFYNSLDDAFNALKQEKIDAVAVGGEYTVEGTRKVAEFEPVDFYIAMPNDEKHTHTRLKSELDDTMSWMLLKDPLFELELHHKYFGEAGKERPYFSKKEQFFIHKSDAIRVAVLADDEPYSFKQKDGTITGLIPEYYNSLRALSQLQFTFISFNSIADARDALQSRQVDILGLYCNDIIDAGAVSLNLTDSYTLMNVVQVTRKGTVNIQTAAVDARESDLIHDRLVKSNISLMPYRTSQKGFDALRQGKVDALITELPAAMWLLNTNRSSDYTITLLPSCNWEASSALPSGSSTLLSIINKSIVSSGSTMSELITKDTLQHSSDMTKLLNHIPISWAISASMLFFIMIVLLSAAIIIIIRRNKQETEFIIKQAESRQKEKALAEQTKVNEENDRFYSTISRDIRTPLNGVIGFSTLASRTSDINKIQEYISKIEFSGKLLLDLLNDTLLYSRISNGKLVLHNEPVDNYELIKYIAIPLKQESERCGITLSINSSKARRRTVLTDQIYLQKILYNILSNAFKFTQRGGHVSFSVETVPFNSSNADTIIIVQDDGIGISPAFLPHIYDTFAQERRNQREAKGSGLGLAIVKQLVAIFGASIDVKSTVGKGTTVTLKFHFKESNTAASQHLTLTTPSYSEDRLTGKHILLCEDNEMNCEIAKAILEARGMIVIVASDGKECVEMFSKSETHSIDAILMDLRMPIMDGFKATAAIRALKRLDAKSIPILAMSADAFEDIVQMCLHAGMNGHIAKPIDTDILYTKLSECIIN